MITKIGVQNQSPLRESRVQKTSSPIAKNNVVPFQGSQSASMASSSLVASAIRAQSAVKLAQTVSFTGLNDHIRDIRNTMMSCGGQESAGEKLSTHDLMLKYLEEMTHYDDAIETTMPVFQENRGGLTYITDGRLGMSRDHGNVMNCKLLVKPPRLSTIVPQGKDVNPVQTFKISETPLTLENLDLKTYFLITKGKPMAVVEDEKNKTVLLTNSGTIELKQSKDFDSKDPLGVLLKIEAKNTENVFKPFTPVVPIGEDPKFAPSVGRGAELTVGMQAGRYVPETIAALEEFCEKVKSGEIDFGPFVQREGADKLQIALLAGGFGSRAEHANVASNKIFHFNENMPRLNAKESNAQTNKGIIELPTGLSAMTTTFRTLHEAGLLNCSKDTLKLGDNLKMYINASDVNRGNGGFSLDMYKKIKKPDMKGVLFLPNDSISRMTEATKQVLDKTLAGDAAMVMIAKKVSQEDAAGKLGIMRIDDSTKEIQAFAEKPKVIPSEYIDKDDNMCISNTFQFTVTPEAFEAIGLLEPYIPLPKNPDANDESRDWSKAFTPIVMALIHKDTLEETQEDIAKTLKIDKDVIPQDVIQGARDLVKGKKIFAVPTAEPWVDAGTLDTYYHTMMQIASNDFKLSNTERRNALKCINTQTGLVASNEALKKEVEENYDINGEVVAVNKAKYVSPNIEARNREFITYNT